MTKQQQKPKQKITRFVTALIGAAVLGVVINMVLPIQARFERATVEDLCVRHSGESVIVAACDEESGWLASLASANPFSNVHSNFRDPIY